MSGHIVIAGEEGGPRGNMLGGIWNVIDAEARVLSSMRSSGGAEEEVVVAGPWYRHPGADWSAEKNRLTDASSLRPLAPAGPLAQAVASARAVGAEVGLFDGGGFTYALFDVEGCSKRSATYRGRTLSCCDLAKAEAYDLVGLDSLRFEGQWGSREYGHYLALSNAVAEFVRVLASAGPASLHCHEFGLFYAAAKLEALGVPVRTLCTLHATKAGRAWGREALGKVLRGERDWHPWTPRCLAELERLAARSDVVSFVGDTTRAEARLFYGVDGVVVRNGVTVAGDKVDEGKRDRCRQRIQSFLSDAVHDVYDGERIEPEHILPVVTVSRLEIENKGYGELLDALLVLERVVRSHIRSGTVDEETRVVCLMVAALGPKDPRRLPKGFPVYLPEELLVGDEVRLKNMVVANDLHVKSLATGRRVVTAVYCPQWVGPGDGGMGMAIDELFAGSVAAVFPSNYEPFLLTGLEAGQEGTPLVISRASGFSDAVREYDQKMGAVHGAILVDNVKLPQRELVVDYAMALDSILYAYLRDRRTYRMMSSEVFRLAKDMSWEEPVRRYHDILRSAHGEAGAHPA